MSSRRDRRTQHAARRAGRSGEINVVSLIDIFAILVFYLLVNALVVEIIPEYDNLALPASRSPESPVQTITVAVSTREILLDQRVIMTTADALAHDQPLLQPLSDALVPLATAASDDKLMAREINIVADSGTPYRLLKKVLATCTDARFDRISFAVMAAAAGDGA